MSTIDFRKYLNAAGLGESAPVRRRKANVKPKAFNPMAFAESYKFIAEDGKRMALSNNRLNKELRGIAAKGEAGAEEFKQKFKDGMAKVKKVLIELYDKIIRFFTETVRYWMSNERKVAKTISNLQAAKKGATKKETFTIPYVVAGKAKKLNTNGGAGESFYGFGEEGEENTGNTGNEPTPDERADAEVEKISAEALNEATAKAIKSGNLDKIKTGLGTPSEIERFEKEIEAQCNTLNSTFVAVSERLIYSIPLASISFQGLFVPVIEGMGTIAAGKGNLEGLTLDQFKENVSRATESLKKTVKTINDAIKPDFSKTMKVKKANYVKVIDILIRMLEMVKDEGRGMRSLNQQIRGFVEAKRKLQQEFKENKNPSEAETLKYQIARTAIQTQTTFTNMYIGINDKLIGVAIQIASKVASAA